MYPKDVLYSGEAAVFLETYCYFDTDSYSCLSFLHNTRIKGGPRKRMLLSDNPESQNGFIQTKFPLFYAKESVIPDSHRNYPNNINRSKQRPIAFLRHYKFTFLHELDAFKSYIDYGTLGNEVKELEIYLDAYENNPDLSFYYEDSQKLNSSMDLLRVNICNKRFFKKFLATHGMECKV